MTGFQSLRAGGAAFQGKLALAALATFALACGSAAAQDWPQRPISFIVPFPAGGGTDTFARPLAAQLDKQLGTRAQIDNRGGAGGTIGAAAAAKAEANGYNVLRRRGASCDRAVDSSSSSTTISRRILSRSR